MEEAATTKQPSTRPSPPQEHLPVDEKPPIRQEPSKPPPSIDHGHKATPSSATITSSESSMTLSSPTGSSDMSIRRQPLPRAPAQRNESYTNAPTYTTLRSVPQSPEVTETISRPPVGPRNISLPGHAPRRSVSQIARDMERHAIADRQSTFEAHQGHRSFVGGCSLCSMDYDRM